jgi:hypothetical protein
MDDNRDLMFEINLNDDKDCKVQHQNENEHRQVQQQVSDVILVYEIEYIDLYSGEVVKDSMVHTIVLDDKRKQNATKNMNVSKHFLRLDVASLCDQLANAKNDDDILQLKTKLQNIRTILIKDYDNDDDIVKELIDNINAAITLNTQESSEFIRAMSFATKFQRGNATSCFSSLLQRSVSTSYDSEIKDSNDNPAKIQDNKDKPIFNRSNATFLSSDVSSSILPPPILPPLILPPLPSSSLFIPLVPSPLPSPPLVPSSVLPSPPSLVDLLSPLSSTSPSISVILPTTTTTTHTDTLPKSWTPTTITTTLGDVKDANQFQAPTFHNTEPRTLRSLNFLFPPPTDPSNTQHREREWQSNTQPQWPTSSPPPQPTTQFFTRQIAVAKVTDIPDHQVQHRNENEDDAIPGGRRLYREVQVTDVSAKQKFTNLFPRPLQRQKNFHEITEDFTYLPTMAKKKINYDD